MADQVFGDDGEVAVLFFGSLEDFPVDLRSHLRHPTIDLAVEEFHNLGATLVPPVLRRADLFTVVHHQWVGEPRIRVRF